MKKLFGFICLFILATVLSFGQTPGTQIPLTGSIGINGNAYVLGFQNLNFTTDANMTPLIALQWSSRFLKITSSVSLTAPRTIVLPLNVGMEYSVRNATTGGQSVLLIGPSGTGVVITPLTNAIIMSDGTNYYQLAGNSITGNFYLPSIGGNSGQVYIASQSIGSGYTGAWVATATGGGCSTEPVIYTNGGYGPYGNINFGLVNTGVGCTSAPSVAITTTNGGTYTTPASVTLALENTVVTVNSAGLLSSRQVTGTGGIVEQTGPTINNPILSVPTITGGWGGYGSNGATPVLTWSSGCYLAGTLAGGTLVTGCGINFQGGNYTGVSVGSGGISFLNTTPSLYFKPQLYNFSYPQPSGFVAYLGEPTGSPIALAPYTFPGSGYSGTPVCTIVGGTLYGGSPDTCTAVIYSSSTVTNGIQVTLAGTGLYTGLLPTISVTGVTGGSSFRQYLVYSTPASPSHAFWADPDGSFYMNSGMGNYTNPWFHASDSLFQATSLSSGSGYGCLHADPDGFVSTMGSDCGGGEVYPGAGISVSTGSAWDTPLTAPSSALVGVSDTQTITNKTFADNTPKFNNSADYSLFLTLQAGVSTNQQTGFQIKNKAGSVIWKIFMDTDSYQSFNIVDVLSGVSRFRIQDPFVNSATYINSYNGGAVEINADANSGVGGLRVWNGNSTPSIIAAFNSPTSIQFPGLYSTTINYLTQVDTSGNFTSTSSIPNGITATTQTAGDNSTKVATTAYVATAVAAGGSSVSAGQGVSDISGVLSTTSVTTSQIPFGNNSPITSLEEIQVIPTAFAFTIPTNGIISGSTTMRNATSQLYLQTLPTATWIMSIYKYPAATAGCLSSVGSSIGTVSLSTSGVQTWSVTSTSFAIGDCLVLVAPSVVDTSAAGLYGSIAVVD